MSGKTKKRNFANSLRACLLLAIAILFFLLGFIGIIFARAQQSAERVYLPLNLDNNYPSRLATIKGQLLNLYTGEPMQFFPIKLTELYCLGWPDCYMLLDTSWSPASTTDADGYFEIGISNFWVDVEGWRLFYGWIEPNFYYYELGNIYHAPAAGGILDIGQQYTYLNESPWEGETFTPTPTLGPSPTAYPTANPPPSATLPAPPTSAPTPILVATP